MGQREDEADDHWTEFGDGPAYDPDGYAPAQPTPGEVLNGDVPEGMMTLADDLNDKADELDAMDARGQVWGLEEWADLMRRAALALSPSEQPEPVAWPSEEMEAEVDRIMAMTDEEILTDAARAGLDPQKEASRCPYYTQPSKQTGGGGVTDAMVTAGLIKWFGREKMNADAAYVRANWGDQMRRAILAALAAINPINPIKGEDHE